MSNYTQWKKKFDKLSSEYIKNINWETVVFDEKHLSSENSLNGTTIQAADDLQYEAFRKTISFFDSIDEWDDYDKSCEDRTDFAYDLEEQWQDVLSNRKLKKIRERHQEVLKTSLDANFNNAIFSNPTVM